MPEGTGTCSHNALLSSLSKVDTAVSSERERLEAEQRAALDKLQQKHAQELDALKQDAERRHREQVRCCRTPGGMARAVPG